MEQRVRHDGTTCETEVAGCGRPVWPVVCEIGRRKDPRRVWWALAADGEAVTSPAASANRHVVAVGWGCTILLDRVSDDDEPPKWSADHKHYRYASHTWLQRRPAESTGGAIQTRWPGNGYTSVWCGIHPGPSNKGSRAFWHEFQDSCLQQCAWCNCQFQPANSSTDDAGCNWNYGTHDITGREEDQAKQSISDAGILGRQRFSSNAGGVEFDRCLLTPVSADVNALKWWRDNEGNFPQAVAVTACYLAIPATSVPSKWQFSASGRLIMKLRSQLDPYRVDTMIFYIRICRWQLSACCWLFQR